MLSIDVNQAAVDGQRDAARVGQQFASVLPVPVRGFRCSGYRRLPLRPGDTEHTDIGKGRGRNWPISRALITCPRPNGCHRHRLESGCRPSSTIQELRSAISHAGGADGVHTCSPEHQRMASASCRRCSGLILWTPSAPPIRGGGTVIAIPGSYWTGSRSNRCAVAAIGAGACLSTRMIWAGSGSAHTTPG